MLCWRHIKILSVEKGYNIISRRRPNKKRKGTSITTVRDQYLSFATFPTPLVSHWSLPLTNWKTFLTKIGKEYYLASFCWWIPSSCENHFNLMRIPDKMTRMTEINYYLCVGQVRWEFRGLGWSWGRATFGRRRRRPPLHPKLMSCTSSRNTRQVAAFATASSVSIRLPVLCWLSTVRYRI